jgi:hypothetical protein
MTRCRHHRKKGPGRTFGRRKEGGREGREGREEGLQGRKEGKDGWILRNERKEE